MGHSPRAVSPAPFAPLPPPPPPPPPLISPPPTAAQAGGTPQSARLAAQQAAQQVNLDPNPSPSPSPSPNPYPNPHPNPNPKQQAAQQAAHQHAVPPPHLGERCGVDEAISRGSGWAPSCPPSTPAPPAPPAPALAADLGLEVRLHVGEPVAGAAPPTPTVLLPSFAPPTTAAAAAPAAAAAAAAAAVPEAAEPEVEEPRARGVRAVGRWKARLCAKGGRVSCAALGSDGASLWVATSAPAAAGSAAAEGGVAAGERHVVRAWRLADDVVGASWSRQFELPSEVGATHAPEPESSPEPSP